MIDVDRLRIDLKNDFLAMGFNVSPAALLEVEKIDYMSDDDIINLAISYGYDITRYELDSRYR